MEPVPVNVNQVLKRRALVVPAVVALSALVVPSVVDRAVARSAAPAPAGPGCDSTRSATGYGLGGRPVTVASKAPVPCLVATGFGGSETQMAVTSDPDISAGSSLAQR